MSSSETQRSEVYHALLEFCRPWSAAYNAPDVEAAGDGFLSPADPIAAVRALVEKFGRDAVLAAGIGTADGEGVRPDPRIADPEACLLPLRMGPETPPYDVLTDKGSLTGRLPVLAGLRDFRTITGLDQHNDGMVYLTFTIADALQLRRWGLAAAPAYGLECVEGHEFIEFARLAGLVEAESESEESKGTYFLFVGWQPARWTSEPADGLKQVAEHFKKLDRNTFDAGDLRVWSPSSDRLSAWAPLLATDKLLRDAFKSSVDYDNRLLVPRPAPPPKPHVKFRDALASLHDAQFGNDPKSVRLAELDYHDAVRREFISPLLETAANISDPMHRGLVAIQAMLIQQVHLWMAGLGQATSNRMENTELIRRALAEIDRIERMTKPSPAPSARKWKNPWSSLN